MLDNAVDPAFGSGWVDKTIDCYRVSIKNLRSMARGIQSVSIRCCCQSQKTCIRDVPTRSSLKNSAGGA